MRAVPKRIQTTHRLPFGLRPMLPLFGRLDDEVLRAIVP